MVGILECSKVVHICGQLLKWLCANVQNRKKNYSQTRLTAAHSRQLPVAGCAEPAQSGRKNSAIWTAIYYPKCWQLSSDTTYIKRRLANCQKSWKKALTHKCVVAICLLSRAGPTWASSVPYTHTKQAWGRHKEKLLTLLLDLEMQRHTYGKAVNSIRHTKKREHGEMATLSACWCCCWRKTQRRTCALRWRGN